MSGKYKNRKYDVEPYNPKWKVRFKEEARVLSSIFGASAIKIEHIGSTAVPGLAGKPTIDILVVVDNIKVVDSFIEQMRVAGYKSLGEYVMPGARLFVREVDNNRLVNIHVFPKDHSHIKEMLNLRDYLCSHPELVKEYSQLKYDLFKKYPGDYGEYRKYKDQWMERLKNKTK